jgi:hypothetical protein
MPTLLKRRKKKIIPSDRPSAVTGNFELHYEEVVRNNRFAIIAFAVTGLLAITAFIPSAVYQSVAGTNTVTIEAEDTMLEGGVQISSDTEASDGLFIIFAGDASTDQP